MAKSTSGIALPLHLVEERVVVTGTRTPKLLEESPVSIDVVTAEEIETLSVGTLDEVLDYLPGVYLSESVKEGSNIMIRGFDGDRVLVLVDGQRLLAPTGASVDFAQISALDIDRIEIVRGASSALYGSEAMGGVINIITKSRGKNQFTFSQESGALEDNHSDYLDALISLSGNWGGKYFGINGYLQLVDKPAFDPDDSDPAQLNASLDKTLAQLQFSYGNGEFESRYKYQFFEENKLRVEERIAGGGFGEYRSNVDKQSHGLSLIYGDIELNTQFISHQETSGDRGSLRDTEIDLFEFDSQYTWGNLGAEWVGGLHLYRDGLNQVKDDGTKEVDNESADGVELFVSGDWQLSERLEAVAGVRVQQDSGYDRHESIKFSSKYEIPLAADKRFVWRASLGDGYRVPTLKERYYEFDHSHLGYVVLGNEALLPEEVLSFSTSLEYSGHFGHFDLLNAEVSVHASEGKNFIDSIEDPALSWRDRNDVDVSQYQNIESTEIVGGDVSGKVSMGNHSLQLNYNYLDARDAATDRRLQSRPYNQVKVNYRIDLPRNFNFLMYSLYKQGEAVSKKASDATQDKDVLNNEFATLNLTVSHKLNFGLTWKLGVKNIFNTHQDYDIDTREQFDLRTTTGRYFFASFKYQLN